MLQLQINKFNRLVCSFNDYRGDDLDFLTFIFHPFFESVDKSSMTTEDILLWDNYKNGISNLLNHELDICNGQFEYNCNRFLCCLDKIWTTKNSLLYFPIASAINSRSGENIFPLYTQMNNSNNDFIIINPSDIIDVMFYLNSHGLFSDIIISKCVDSTSKDTLLCSKLLMESGENYDVDISDNKHHTNNHDILVFDENLKLYEVYKQHSDLLDYTLIDLASCIYSDIKTMNESNRLNMFYIREYLHPYIESYFLKIEGIIEDNNTTNMIFNFFRIVDETIEIYKKYRHECTRYCLIMLFLATKMQDVGYKCNVDNGPVLSKYIEKIELIKLIDEKSTSCEIYPIMKILNESFLFLGVSRGNNSTDFKQSANEDEFDNLYNLMSLNENSVFQSVNENFMNDNRIEPKSNQAIIALNEAFEIKKDGTIKVVLKGRTSLMDEYSANHRLLKLNDQMGDIESMKYNLVYALLIVESADRILHNSKIKSSSKAHQDAEKAKSFATNDIVTYLPKVKLRDKGFDLNTFYKKVRADEYTIEVDGVSLVSGLKNIAKAIFY